LVIFAAFRDAVPSMAVIAAAAGDIVFAMAGMVILGIPLTLGSLAALLMLIGYSVDTDILLSTRVLRRSRKSLKKRIWGSVKTGLTMSSGGIAGFTILFFVSRAIVGPSELSNIAAVMVLGLVADMPFTWFGNAIILKKYVNGEFNFEVFNR
ncbi:MAG: protein translocase subunit SecF, partial [Candidatus Aenigmatarchaeota archaeon]